MMYRWESVLLDILGSLVGLVRSADSAVFTGLGFGGYGEPHGSAANGVSADGMVVVGHYETPVGRRAFVWNMQDGAIEISWPMWSNVHEASSDGSVIVGSSLFASGIEQAFYYTTPTGIVGIGRLGDDFESLAYSVSGDGKTVVGYSRNDLERTAFMWDEDHGMRSVQSVLENEFGLDLTGWHLASALDVSQDGRTIVGWGYNPDGYQEAWVAVIPEPGSFVLILLGVVGITQRVRNRSTVRIQRTTYHRQDSNSHQSS